MTIAELLRQFDPAQAGARLHAMMHPLQPIARSLTGNGVRETLRLLQQHLPLEITEVPTGTKVLDWEIPREWNLRAAHIKDSRGRIVADAAQSALHVVGYSVPVQGSFSLAELRPHLHSLPDHPDWIPYRTSYYKETWGFCLPQRVLENLKDNRYEVLIDASLAPGSLTYGSHVKPGTQADEVLISTHICHPAMANDNLSGMVVAAKLAELLAPVPTRYTYRFLFIPGTLGSIAWLAQNAAAAARVKAGLVLAGVGDAGPLNYKRSRQGLALVDRAMELVIAQDGRGGRCVDFSPYGYDERQYCSPGFNMPVGCLMRTPHGEYPEYHTSADDLDFVRPESLAGALQSCLELVNILESNARYVNLQPHGEPQLGRRGLYDTTGGAQQGKQMQMAFLWVLNYSDGTHDLLDIAQRARLPFSVTRDAAQRLRDAGLLQEVAEPAQG